MSIINMTDQAQPLAEEPCWDVTRSNAKGPASQTSYARYGFALGMVAMVFLIRYALEPAVKGRIAVSPFIPAVLLAAWYGRLGPGLFALSAGWLLADVFFIPPAFGLGSYTTEQAWHLVVYLVSGALGLAVIERLHRAHGKLISLSAHQKALQAQLRERQSAEEALRQSEHRFRVLATHSPAGIFMTSPAGQCLYVNERWCELAGMSAEAADGAGWFKAVHPEDLPRMEKEWVTATGSGLPFDANYRFRTPDGQVRWLHGRAVPLKNRHDEITGYLGSVTDLTAHRQAEQALQQKLQAHAADLEERVSERTARLEESLESMKAILYHVTHDLRAPVRSIQGFTDLVLQMHAAGLEPEVLDCLQRSFRASQKMERLIDALLEFGRAGYQKMALAMVDLELAVEQTLAGLESQCQAQNAQIIVTRPLPRVWADPSMLDRVLTNLLSNAVKFVPSDCTPRIEIWAEHIGSKVRLNIKDNGIGIAPEDLDKIGKDFIRLDNASDFPGTGVGLAIVRKGIERMGGALGLESQLGQGSRFWLDFQAEADGKVLAMPVKATDQIG